MLLVWIVLYLVPCIALAWFVGRRLAPEGWIRTTAIAGFAALLLVLPLSDEILGCFQMERLCEQAKEVQVHATIPVGEDLYTPQGKWRMTLAEGNPDEQFKNRFRASRVFDSYVRTENRALPTPAGAIDIRGREIRFYDAKDGRLLAEWRQFSTPGGWLSRHLDRPLIVHAQCAPREVLERTVGQRILPFAGPSKS
ncbi:MAG: hypothetical protein JOZ85_15095 [Betaproteobacteria bacterium]|nr:hypothetical protein [Betaproteobacteria bacterium]